MPPDWQHAPNLPSLADYRSATLQIANPRYVARKISTFDNRWFKSLSVKWRRVILFSILLLVAGFAFYLWREQERERKFVPQIRAAADRYRVDPMLVKAVVWRETRFHPDARGKAGEIGLMQLQEVAAQEWADAEHLPTFVHEHCFDPGTNTLAGTFYLGKLIKRYAQTDDPLPYALADYNAGRGNVLKWNSGPAATNSAVFIEQIGFPGTKAYVKSVLRHYAFYRLLNRIGG